MSQYLLDFIYTFTNCMCCFPGSPQLKINSRSFKILRLLGEGGFSYVYLVQDTSTSQIYALKKIRCALGQESVSLALKEVEAYSLFKPHPNIIYCIDHCVSSSSSRYDKLNGSGDEGSKTVYILLPYFRRGNLQDAINANLVNHTKFPERRLMVLILGVAKALKAMHQYRVKGGGDKSTGTGTGKVRKESVETSATATTTPSQTTPADEDEVEQVPLMEGEVSRSQEGIPEGGDRAYAHRDIKPGNIMIADDGKTPILMDLGSIAPSPLPITSRSLALAVQDTAAEHSTLPYRAPELFDVKTGSVIDTKVDIWSLGCTLYACLVGKSPFEARSEETGGSLSICILSGDWRFPDEGKQATGGKGKGRVGTGSLETGAQGDASGANNTEDKISESVKGVVRRCLKVEPAERPDVDELISIVERVVNELPEDGDIED